MKMVIYNSVEGMSNIQNNIAYKMSTTTDIFSIYNDAFKAKT